LKLNLSLPLWLLRLLLASLFFFGSEIVLWQNPLHYTPLEWLIRLIGYPLLATLVLDIAQRYRIRDGYDAMVLLAASALLHSLLINPNEGWSDFLGTLLTRIIGAHALTQMILWGIFLALLRGDIRRFAIYSIFGMAWLGMFWGFWMRWTPELRGTFEAVPLETSFLYTGFFLLPILLYAVVKLSAKELSAANLLLTPLEWGIAAIVLISLFLYQAVIQAVGTSALLTVLVIMTILWAVLWFRRDAKQASMMEKFLPLRPQAFFWLPLALIAFMGAFYIAYGLPRIQAAFVDQLWLMELGFFAVGLFWLPIVASVIAIRGFDRLMREGATL
jgi:hypothetical protein